MKGDRRRTQPSTSHPGETLADLLDMHGMTQAELATKIGRPKKTINEIVKGKASITARTALELERVFHVEARFWMARQASYDLAVERAKLKAKGGG